VRYVRALQQRGIDVYTGSAKWIEPLISTRGYDLAVLGWWEIAESCLPPIRRLSPATRVVIDSIDLHFLRNARRTFTETREAGSSGMLDSNYACNLIRELNTYAAADAVLAASQKEADLINDLTADSAWRTRCRTQRIRVRRCSRSRTAAALSLSARFDSLLTRAPLSTCVRRSYRGSTPAFWRVTLSTLSVMASRMLYGASPMDSHTSA